MAVELQGLVGSPGVGIGKIWVFKPAELTINRHPITDIEKEIIALTNAQKKVEHYLQSIYQSVLESQRKEEAEIFEGHIELLWDEDLIEETHNVIKTEKKSASAAIADYLDEVIEDMRSLADEYMRERAAEFIDLRKNILLALNNQDFASLSDVPDGTIIAAQDLTPTDTAQLNKNKVRGFILEKGGSTSHVAILARNLEIPAVMGVANLLNHVQNGQPVVIDGDDGTAVIEPSHAVLELYKQKQEKQNKIRAEYAELKYEPALTKDKFLVNLYSNIGSPNDIEIVEKFGAEGVGLFRTEFLFMETQKAPTEEEQAAAYIQVAKALGRTPLILRLVDIGGDKPLPYLNFPEEENPFLGWRGIRIYQENIDIFITQIRAVLRASLYGDIRIMVPMVISVDEIVWVRAELNKQAELLRKEGYDVKDIHLGVMIETPAAALISPQIAKHSDFFSIGTNDLTQYTLAVDRGNQKISGLYDSLHPALIRLMKITVDAAKDYNREVGVCGELGGHLPAIPILVGLGFDDLSISGGMLPFVKGLIRKLDKSKCAALVDDVLRVNNAQEVRALIKNWSAENNIEI
ncbi:MAG: phosphoenolpyruvate--protein phosphotransferase [Alphaproteobacteria bacterium]